MGYNGFDLRCLGVRLGGRWFAPLFGVETVNGGGEGVYLPGNLGRTGAAWGTGICLIGRSVTVERRKCAVSALSHGNLSFSYVLYILLIAQVLLESMVELVFLQIGFTKPTDKGGIRVYLQAEYFLCYLLILSFNFVQLRLTEVVM
jgi:hypothetical protein